MATKKPLEMERDYSDYTAHELLRAYQILEIAEIGLPHKDWDKNRKTMHMRRLAIAQELARRVFPE